MKQDRSGEFPFKMPINPLRLGTIGRDVSHALRVRYSEASARDNARKLGLDALIDEGRFPKGTYGYQRELTIIAANWSSDIINQKYALEDSVDHSIVTVLPTKALVDIQLILRKAGNLREKVVRFLDDGVQKVDIP